MTAIPLNGAFSIQGYPRILNPTAIPSKDMHGLFLKPLQAQTLAAHMNLPNELAGGTPATTHPAQSTSAALKYTYNLQRHFHYQFWLPKHELKAVLSAKTVLLGKIPDFSGGMSQGGSKRPAGAGYSSFTQRCSQQCHETSQPVVQK